MSSALTSMTTLSIVSPRNLWIAVTQVRASRNQVFVQEKFLLANEQVIGGTGQTQVFSERDLKQPSKFIQQQEASRETVLCQFRKTNLPLSLELR